jgi:anti-anti-sigma factor
LRDAIDELLAENRKKILLNLSEVAFLDSAGVGELVAGLKTARRFGAELKLLNVGERVYSTLDMTRLLPTFETYDDEAEAVRSFGPLTGRRRGASQDSGSSHRGRCRSRRARDPTRTPGSGSSLTSCASPRSGRARAAARPSARMPRAPPGSP